MSDILVLGATGTTGGEVARQLIAAGHRPRLLVRSPDKAAAFQGHAEIVQGDLDDPASLDRALQGVQKVYMVSAGGHIDALERNVVDAAKRAGVRHVVKLSVISADQPSIGFAKLHGASEAYLKASGLAWTMIRPGNFMTNSFNWAGSIKAQGAFYEPLGAGRYAMVDPADIAGLAVAALTQPGHEGQAYTLTGPVSMDDHGYAAILAEVLGTPVRYVDVPPEAAREAMLGMGIPAGYVELLLELLATMKTGAFDAVVTADVERVLGRTPGTYRAWAERNASAFR